jgi:hypothetical protein
MKRSAAGGVAVLALLLSSAVAVADPVVPQVDTPCTANLSEVTTWPPGAKMPLVCQDGQWRSVTTPQPPSDRWLSYGPEVRLHGEGMRNPEVRSGKWTATPQDSASRCRAEQSVVVGPGVVGQPEIAEAQAGEPLEFTILPRLFDIALSGNCLWERVI